MRASLASTWLLAAACGLTAPSVHADWRKDYDLGMKAFEAQQWSEAEAAFRAALSEDAEASARKRFQGVVIKLYVPHYYAGMAALRQGNCERALQYWRHPGSAAVVATQAGLQAEQTRGIAECTTRLAADKAPTDQVASTPPAPTPRPTPTPPPRRPETPPPTRPAPQAPPVTAPAAAAAPAALVAAVESYLAGRHSVVVQIDPSSLGDARSRAHGLLLRAASRHALAELADNDARQLEQARQDVRAARAALSSLRPDEIVYPPRFRSFWTQTR